MFDPQAGKKLGISVFGAKQKRESDAFLFKEDFWTGNNYSSLNPKFCCSNSFCTALLLAFVNPIDENGRLTSMLAGRRND